MPALNENTDPTPLLDACLSDPKKMQPPQIMGVYHGNEKRLIWELLDQAEDGILTRSSIERVLARVPDLPGFRRETHARILSCLRDRHPSMFAEITGYRK
jgi:hypothetical protein